MTTAMFRPDLSGMFKGLWSSPRVIFRIIIEICNICRNRKDRTLFQMSFFHSIFSLPGNYFLRVRATATMLRRRRRDTPADSPANILPAGAPSSGWEYELYVTTPTVMKRIPPTSETKHSWEGRWSVSTLYTTRNQENIHK